MVEETHLEWDTIRRTRTFECEAFEVFTECVRLPNGSETRFDYVAEPPSAVVLPITVSGEVVVLEEYRHAVGRVALGLPGGSLEPGDVDMEAAAVRELHEEAGYFAQSMEPLLVAEPANGILDSERHYFKASGCEPSVGTDRDTDESIHVRTMAYDDLVDQVVDGRVRDERTVTAVLFDQVYREPEGQTVDRLE